VCEAPFTEERRDVTTHSTIAPRETLRFTENPLTCRYCGVIDHARIDPGKGPHHAAAVCRHCGRCIQWLSQHSSEVRQARRQQARLEAMARKAPSPFQIAYLLALGYAGTCPVTMLEASTLLDSLLQQSQAPDNRIEDSAL
jgi:hypothetical protein